MDLTQRMFTGECKADRMTISSVFD